MKKICVFLIAFLMVSVSSFASPIPDLLSETMDFDSFPPVDADLSSQPPVQAIPQPNIDTTQLLSGVAYFATVGKSSPAEPADNLIEPYSDTAIGLLAPDSSVLGTVNMTMDSNQDVEPSVISIDKSGTVWTTTVYTKYVYVGYPINKYIPKNYFSTTSTFLPPFNQGQLPIPQNYTRSGDPLLAENPYTTGQGAGNIYASGIIFNGANTITPNGVSVWRSLDGGNTWNNWAIAANNTDPNFFYDKPAIAVSWHSGTDLGWIYVVYNKLNLNQSQNSQFGLPPILWTLS